MSGRMLWLRHSIKYSIQRNLQASSRVNLQTTSMRSLSVQFCLVVAMLFLACGSALATHIVGGEISYEDLGEGNYRVRLVVYRDCGPANQNGTGFDDQASVGIFNGNGALVNVLNIPLAFQNVSNVPVALENPCGTPPPSVCVEQAVYEQVVFIGESVNGFTLSYQRCCRNPSIVNLTNPDDAGATFTTQIPGRRFSSRCVCRKASTRSD